MEKERKEIEQPSFDRQQRLAEILNDSPHIVSLNDTEWEIRALKIGTQNLIAEKVLNIKKAEDKTFGDIIKQFSVNTPALLDILTLAIANDRYKIFKDGDKNKGYSDYFNSIRETLEWECNEKKLGEILFEILEMINIDFFFQMTRSVDIFRKSCTEKRRMMTKKEEQK